MTTIDERVVTTAQVARLCQAIGVRPGMVQWVTDGPSPNARRLRLVQLKTQVRLAWRKKLREVRDPERSARLEQMVAAIQRMDLPPLGSVPFDLREQVEEMVRVGWRWASIGWAAVP